MLGLGALVLSIRGSLEPFNCKILTQDIRWKKEKCWEKWQQGQQERKGLGYNSGCADSFTLNWILKREHVYLTDQIWFQVNFDST